MQLNGSALLIEIRSNTAVRRIEDQVETEFDLVPIRFALPLRDDNFLIVFGFIFNGLIVWYPRRWA